MLHETIEGLNIKPDGVYVDVTFGGGGHSREILKKIDTGKLIAFDQDTDAQKNAEEFTKDESLNKKFAFIRSNFAYIKNFLRYQGINKVDGILADLGVSSHQFDVEERGFSYRFKGEIDMRMNPEAKTTATDILNNYSDEDLTRILKNYGEIKNPQKIVKQVVEARKNDEIKYNEQLVELLNPVLPDNYEFKILSKIYQALRIETNKEIEVLNTFLKDTTELLNPGGRLVVLTYHSLEDRPVKNFMKTGNIDGVQEKDLYGNMKKDFKLINKKVIISSQEELKRNVRSRSAKLRIAEKL